MGYRLTLDEMDRVLEELSSRYRVFAPVYDRRTRSVRFGEITSVSQIVTDRQSDFSAKEVYYPVMQVMYYFRDGGVEDSTFSEDRDYLIIARACDINAVRRLDNVFLHNGDTADLFYARRREKVRFILLECGDGFDQCFCVSVGANKTDEHAAALRIGTEDVLAAVRDSALEPYFSAGRQTEYQPEFPTKNKKTLRIPALTKQNLKTAGELPFWEQFNDRCMACGGCNTVCGTCSCFDTADVTYTQGSADGERRRLWSSCMLRDFTQTAGGGLSRKTQGANMRFKVFHKFYDYAARFDEGENMCVGCGRCDMRCPQKISFFDTVCQLHDLMERGNGE